MDNRLSYKLEYDDALPITKHRAEIVEAIRTQQLIIVAGETGSGKTTQLPKFCLEAQANCCKGDGRARCRRTGQ